jgi:hypothetical protein
VQQDPFEVWLIVNPDPLSALLEFGPLSAPFWSFGPLTALLKFWPVVDPFESTFTSHLPSSLAAPPAFIFFGNHHHLRLVPGLHHHHHRCFGFQTQGVRIFYLELKRDVKIFYIILVYYVAL